MHADVTDTTFFPALIQWYQRTFDCSDLDAQDVVVAGGVGRLQVAPASVHGHPTVLIRRLEGIECNVDFIVEKGDKSPRPSAICGSLGELANMAAGFGIVESR